MRTACAPCALAVAVAVVSAVVGGVGCVDKTPASDVRGNYDVAFDDKLTIKLDVGGAEQTQQGTESDVVTFQVAGRPLTLDLAQFCAKPDVKCPSETLWTKIAVDQPNIDARVKNSHVVNVVDDRVHDLPAGQKAEAIGGLVDASDAFTLLVGGDSRGQGDCGLLALSVAEGRFTHEGESVVDEPAVPADAGHAADGGSAPADGGFTSHVTFPPGSPVNGIADGALKVGFLGACAFGPAVVGATLELSTGFTGTRTGDFDPPPFVPIDPSTVPIGTDAGPVDDLDAGVADGG